MDPTRFTGRVALVTGAASGIGRATALRLAREGASVACVDRDSAGAAAVRKEIEFLGGRAIDVVCYVGDSESVAAAAREAQSSLGDVDILANVAGTGDTAGLEGIEGLNDERWNRVLAVNLGGPFMA